MPHWLILTATPPTRPSGLRVRAWRALKATHADDDALLDAALPLFDALHTAFGTPR